MYVHLVVPHMLFFDVLADSDSGSSSGSDSEAEEGQSAGAGLKAQHDKV